MDQNSTKHQVLSIKYKISNKGFILCTLCLILNTQFCYAKDKIEKGFERLAVYDYFRAREYFIDAVKKLPAPAYYGLSLISSRTDNPFYNIDSARVYILRSDSAFHAAPMKQRMRFEKKYRFSEEDLKVRKDSIALIAWQKANDERDIEIWNEFIVNYAWSSLKDSAIAVRNSLAYAIARKRNTSDAYKDFFRNYPSAAETIEAQRHYEETLFKEKTKSGTEAAFSSFINAYAESPHRPAAEDSLFLLLTKNKTLSEYHSFAKKYPANRNAETSWMKLYNRYLEMHGTANIQRFLDAYSDFPYRYRVMDDYKWFNVLLLPYRKAGKWGFVTEDGKPVIEAQYEEVDFFSEGLSAVEKNQKYGYINKAGKKVIDFRFDEAEPFDSISGMAIVKLNGKAALINRDGEFLFEPKFEEVSYIHDDRILFLDNGNYGYCNRSGQVVIPAKFETANDFVTGTGIAVVIVEDQFGVIDVNGRWILKPEFDYIAIETNELIKAQQDGKFGLFNRFGENLWPAEYDALNFVNLSTSSGQAPNPQTSPTSRDLRFASTNSRVYIEVKQKGRSGLMDAEGNVIIPLLYDDLRFGGDSLPVAVKRKGKWGFVDMDHKTVIPFRYEDAFEFTEGYGRVKMKNLWGVIDVSGKIILPFQYDGISGFKNGLAIVRKQALYGLINAANASSRTELVPIEYQKYSWLEKNIIRFERENKFGYYSSARKDWIWKEDGL